MSAPSTFTDWLNQATCSHLDGLPISLENTWKMQGPGPLIQNFWFGSDSGRENQASVF